MNPLSKLRVINCALLIIPFVLIIIGSWLLAGFSLLFLGVKAVKVFQALKD